MLLMNPKTQIPVPQNKKDQAQNANSATAEKACVRENFENNII